MIRFALHCANDHTFEAWFRDGQTFDRQAKDRSIACPTCGDSSVRKAMMAPAVVRATSMATATMPAAPPPAPPTMPVRPDDTKAAIMIAMLRKMREHVEKNFENVGDRFPDEARRIHYGEAEEREIYGRASIEEAKELVEEGISIRPLPEVPELDG
jgi:hypothetical protein